MPNYEDDRDFLEEAANQLLLHEEADHCPCIRCELARELFQEEATR